LLNFSSLTFQNQPNVSSTFKKPFVPSTISSASDSSDNEAFQSFSNNNSDKDYNNISFDELQADIQNSIDAQSLSRKAHRKMLVKRMRSEILRLEKIIIKVKCKNDRLRKQLVLKQLANMRVDN
jgi:hypothetical protein